MLTGTLLIRAVMTAAAVGLDARTMRCALDGPLGEQPQASLLAQAQRMGVTGLAAVILAADLLAPYLTLISAFAQRPANGSQTHKEHQPHD